MKLVISEERASSDEEVEVVNDDEEVVVGVLVASANNDVVVKAAHSSNSLSVLMPAIIRKVTYLLDGEDHPHVSRQTRAQKDERMVCCRSINFGPPHLPSNIATTGCLGGCTTSTLTLADREMRRPHNRLTTQTGSGSQCHWSNTRHGVALLADRQYK